MTSNDFVEFGYCRKSKNGKFLPNTNWPIPLYADKVIRSTDKFD